MTRPRTIIFDLSEVLIAGLIGIENEIARRCCISSVDVLAHFGGEHLGKLCRGHLTEDEYFDHAYCTGTWTLERAELRQIIRANFQQKVADMEPLLHALHADYELALLSDHAREWVDHIRTVHPFLELFSACFFSFEIGATKAETACFQHVLRRLGREPHECLFIDDSERNVVVASSLGISSIRFTNAAALRDELRRRGIL